jgi:hypothetical protein
MLTFYPSRIPDPGVKKAPDPGSGSATLVNGLTTGLSGQIPTDGFPLNKKDRKNILYFLFNARNEAKLNK